MQVRNVATLLPTTLALCCLFALALPQPATAQARRESTEAATYQIAAGSLESALNKFATQSKLQVVYSPELVAGKTSTGLSGKYAPKVALSILLTSTGLTWDALSESMYVLKKASDTRRQGGPAPKTETGMSASKDEATVQDLEKMVVVGSRLAVSPYDAMSLAKIISREEIERSGVGSIAQALSYLSEVSINNSGDSATGTVGGSLSGKEVGASTVQLRGLPQGTTLVLINGRRTGSSASGYGSDFFDLSTIPLALVERIEVLPMGASAVYGGDGLAGVVNIVLRKDAEGFEVQARHMDADGYSEQTASATMGKSWARGRFMGMASWRRTTELASSERDLTATEDYRRFGGYDGRRPYASYPGNIYSLAGCPEPGEYGYSCYSPLSTRGNLPGLSSSFAGIPIGQSGNDLTPADFQSNAGVLNLRSREFQIVAPSEQVGIGFNASIELPMNIELFTEWALSKRTVDAKEISLSISGGEYGSLGAVIPATNPYNPFGTAVGVDYLFEHTGIFQKYSQTFWRGLAGVKSERGRWGWELTTWQSVETSNTGGIGGFEQDAIISALASTDPRTALNLFSGDGAAPTSPENLLALIERVRDRFSTKVQGVNGFVRRAFKLPTGDVNALLGMEYERTTLSAMPWDTSIASVEGEDDRQAIFTEVRVPLWTASSWNRLTLTGAARYESTGRSQGHALTKSVGVDLKPTEFIVVRASYGTAFKPLNLFTALTEPQIYESTVSDPQFGGEYFFVPIIYSGGTPKGLRPETSSNSSLAFIYAPTAGTRLSIMHWDADFKDRRGFPGATSIVENEADYPGRVIRDPQTGLITLVDARPVNIARTRNAGVDLSAEMLFATAYGEVIPSLSASYAYKYDEQRTSDSQVESHLARWSSSGWSPRWKIVPRIGWSWKTFNANAVARYVSSYVDPEPLVEGANAGKLQSLGDFWLVDLNMTLDVSSLLRNRLGKTTLARVNLGAANVFNRLPEFCSSCASAGWSGYDAMQYDILGRRLHAEVRLQF